MGCVIQIDDHKQEEAWRVWLLNFRGRLPSAALEEWDNDQWDELPNFGVGYHFFKHILYAYAYADETGALAGFAPYSCTIDALRVALSRVHVGEEQFEDDFGNRVGGLHAFDIRCLLSYLLKGNADAVYYDEEGMAALSEAEITTFVELVADLFD